MAFESLTDDRISDLINYPKVLTNPQAKSKQKYGHEQVTYKVFATDGSSREFEVYKRQNLRNGMEDDFSCGISWIAPNGESFILKRYNGSSHDHQNQIEKESLGYKCHIHTATEKYIKANRKADGFAILSNNYCSIKGALHILVTDCKISGIQTTPDNINQYELFNK